MLWVLVSGCVGFLSGGLVVAWQDRRTIQWLQAELTTAQDRLYAAWQDKAIIPPREAVQLAEPIEATPLPDWALPAILDYASPEGRQQAEAFIRQGIAQGKGRQDILRGLTA